MKSKIQKVCSYGYKLVYDDDKFCKPFKTYLGEDAIQKFFNSFIEESKYCSQRKQKHFNKSLG